MNVKKIVGILAILLLAYFIINKPANASNSATSLTNTVKGAADNVLLFFSNITS